MKDALIGFAATLGLLWFGVICTVAYLKDMGAWVR